MIGNHFITWQWWGHAMYEETRFNKYNKVQEHSGGHRDGEGPWSQQSHLSSLGVLGQLFGSCDVS